MRSRTVALAVVGAVWVLGVAGGVWQMYAYATTAGATAATPARWPGASTLPRAEDGSTLVVFVHPDCPCTRATMIERLAAIEADTGVSPRVVVVGRGEAPIGAIRHGVAIADPDAVEAHRFGAVTSGFVVVYDAGGELAFAGGITSERGHAGDNAGRRAALRAIAGDHGQDHDVFGCALEQLHP